MEVVHRRVEKKGSGRFTVEELVLPRQRRADLSDPRGEWRIQKMKSVYGGVEAGQRSMVAYSSSARWTAGGVGRPHETGGEICDDTMIGGYEAYQNAVSDDNIAYFDEKVLGEDGDLYSGWETYKTPRADPKYLRLEKSPNPFNCFVPRGQTGPPPASPHGDGKSNIPPSASGDIQDGPVGRSPLQTPLIMEAVGGRPPLQKPLILEAVGGRPALQQPLISSDRRSRSLEILKCIVYGGLIESIASLSIISSTAASDATTLNVVVIGLATLLSGLIAFGYKLVMLRNDISNEKYHEALGRRGHFVFHSTFAILSYVIFGLVAPVTYGFAFHDSDDKDYKMLAVAAAGFGCIFVLTIAKAYVKGIDRFGGYIKTILNYVTMAAIASGIAYAAGDLIGKLLDAHGWFQPTQVVSSQVSSWASY